MVCGESPVPSGGGPSINDGDTMYSHALCHHLLSCFQRPRPSRGRLVFRSFCQTKQRAPVVNAIRPSSRVDSPIQGRFRSAGAFVQVENGAGTKIAALAWDQSCLLDLSCWAAAWRGGYLVAMVSGAMMQLASIGIVAVWKTERRLLFPCLRLREVPLVVVIAKAILLPLLILHHDSTPRCSWPPIWLSWAKKRPRCNGLALIEYVHHQATCNTYVRRTRQ